MKNPFIYRRKGWKDTTLEGRKESDGTISLLNDAGEVVVSALSFIPDPSEVEPGDFPDSYATGTKPQKSAGSSPPQIDEEKVAAIVDKVKAKSEDDPFTAADLNKVNVPTLISISEALELPVPDDAKSADLKSNIGLAAAAATTSADLTDVDLDNDSE